MSTFVRPASAINSVCARISLRAPTTPFRVIDKSCSRSSELRSTTYVPSIDRLLGGDRSHVDVSMTTTARFTDRQGQYLAFIHAYTKVMKQPPAMNDIA